MKKRKRYSKRILCNLYFNFIISKPTVLILIIGLGLVITGLYFASNPFLDKIDYFKSSDDFHIMYLTQSIFIISVFNSILIAAISLSLANQSLKFDVLFIPNFKRKAICLCKLIAGSIFIFIICLLEFIILFLIPLIRYPYFVITLSDLTGVVYIMLLCLYEFVLNMIVITILPIVFTPMIILFLEIVVKLICNNYDKISKTLTGFIPILEVSNETIAIDMKYSYMSIIWIILYILLYFNVYNIKDIDG